jgi:hypothetical protein
MSSASEIRYCHHKGSARKNRESCCSEFPTSMKPLFITQHEFTYSFYHGYFEVFQMKFDLHKTFKNALTTLPADRIRGFIGPVLLTT